MSLILSVLHQHFLSEESGLNNKQLHYFLSKELAYEARKKEDKKKHTKVRITNIPDIHVVSLPCGPGDVSVGGQAE